VRQAGRQRFVGLGAFVCLLLLFVSSYAAIHIHPWSGSPANEPVAPHHCLLCVAGHLPLTVHASPTAPAAPYHRATALVAEEPGSYDLASTFPFYTRPPPQV